jgi:uncharacterized membrane protein
MTQDSTQVAEQVGSVIDALAVKLKVPAQFVWQILERQAYVEFALAVLSLIVVAAFWFGYVKAWKKWAEEYDLKMPLFFGAAIGVVATIISVIALFVTLGGALNPQYFALNEILSTLK